MRKGSFIGLMALVLVFLWNINGYAGCLRVIAPNGGETLRQNSDYTIRWVNNCDKPVKLVLRQNGRWVGLIANSIPSSQTSYDWKVGKHRRGTAPPGGGYKILVKTMDRTSKDASDGPFTIVASSPPPQQPPRLTSFKINNGAESTSSRTVTLNHTLIGQATHYRACENSNFQGSNCNWKTYTPAPQFQLSSDFGTKTVHFQVRNSSGVSSILSDTITLTLPVIVGAVTKPLIPLDPSIEAASFTVKKTHDRYSVDFSYNITVSSYIPVLRYRDLKIYIEALPHYLVGGDTQWTVLKTLSYTAGQQSNNGITHTGTVTFHFDTFYGSGGYAGGGGSDVGIIIAAARTAVRGVTLRARIALPEIFDDANTANNEHEEQFLWEQPKVLKLSHELTTCVVKDDWNFRVELSGHWWIVKSYLEVPYFGENLSPLSPRHIRWTTVHNEHAEFDTNGVLPLGSYGYRWIKHPTTDDPTGTVHAWCEGTEHHPYKVVIEYFEIIKPGGYIH